MTHQYIQHFHTARAFIFFSLLKTWKGSVYKMVLVELVVFSVLYAALSLSYMFGMTEHMKRQFERMVKYVGDFTDLVPVVFILGFYISSVFARFWSHFLLIPWSVSAAPMIATHLRGGTEDDLKCAQGLKSTEAARRGLRAMQMRRTLVRYMSVAYVMVCTCVNEPMAKEFKSLDSLVERQLLTQEEKRRIEEVPTREPKEPKYFVPLVWSIELLKRARKDGFISNQFGFVTLVKAFQKYHTSCLNLLMMDKVCLPLVYTQVVTIAVYTYALCCIVGRQYLDPASPLTEPNSVMLYVPFFTIIELFVYVGCLKLAQALLNPMGTNDDDFEMLTIFNFCWQASLLIVSLQETPQPALEKDIHWEKVDIELPHTLASLKYEDRAVVGSMQETQQARPVNEEDTALIGDTSV